MNDSLDLLEAFRNFVPLLEEPLVKIVVPDALPEPGRSRLGQMALGKLEVHARTSPDHHANLL